MKNIRKYNQNQLNLANLKENIRNHSFHPDNPSDQDETGLVPVVLWFLYRGQYWEAGPPLP